MASAESHESKNLVLGKLALQSGMVTPEQLRESLSLQAKAFEIGLREDLLEIFVKKGFLSQDQASALGDKLVTYEHWLAFEKELAGHVESEGLLPEGTAFQSVEMLGRGETVLSFEDVLLDQGKIDQRTYDEIATLRMAMKSEGEGTVLNVPQTRPDATVPPVAQARSGSLPGLGAMAGPDGDVKGMVLGDYRVLRELGRGAMGVVYEAEQVSLKRKVALKVLPPELVMSEQRVARFRREAEASAALDHPGIVKVHGMGEESGIHYFAMQFVKGRNLEELLDAERVSLRHACEIMGQAARAVHYAHGKGVIHRDIKPANIMVTDSGKVMIMDFGLARQEEGASSLTASGAVMGTPAYMSPEQALGDRKNVSRLSDIYALGATLYYLASEATPHDADYSEGLHRVLAKIVNEEPVPLRSRNKRVPQALETLVHKALAKNPGRRYASAEAFADDLDRFLAGDPIKARPPSTIERLVWKIRKRKWPVLVGTVVVLALASVYPIWKLGKAGAEGENPEEKLASARAALEGGDADKAASLATYVIRNFPGAATRLRAQKLLARAHEDDDDDSDFLAASARLLAMDRDGAAGAWARVRLAERLLARRKHGGARLLARAAADSAAAGPEEKRDALLALARSAYGLNDYNAAVAHYDQLRRSHGEALGAVDGEVRSRLKKLHFFTPTFTLEKRVRAFVPGDLDGDGACDVAVLERHRLSVLRYEKGRLKVFHEREFADLGQRYLQAGLQADLDGDGRNELVLAAGLPMARQTARGKEGWLKIFRFEGDALRELWSMPVTTEIRPGAIQAGDIDEDGAPELVLGLDFYARRTLFVKYDPRKKTYGIYADVVLPDPRRRSDVRVVRLGDVDGDNVPEVVLGLGPWNAYGLAVLEQALPWRPPYPIRDRLFPFGEVWGLAVADFDGDRMADIAVGKTGTHNAVLFGEGRPCGPVRAEDLLVLGVKPGGYVEKGGLDFAPNEPNLGVIALAAADLAGDERFEIVVLAELAPQGPYHRQEVSVVRVHPESRLEKVVLFEVQGAASRFSTLSVADVDGDGKTEVLVGGSKLLVLGLD